MPNQKKSAKKLKRINKKLDKKEAKRLKRKEWAQMKEEIKETGGSLHWPCGLNAFVHDPDSHAQLCKDPGNCS